ncbi:unnamed protein product [Bemisia tabaci]|uniref:Protein zwilch n=1 Tax=Bemisia tabaci TaxID=7038 RepID=A0A9P0AIA4_BEMTA|nr:unnamed protein product [Bemisia tabaci]
MELSNIPDVLQDLVKDNQLIIQHLPQPPAFIAMFMDIPDKDVYFIHKKPIKEETFNAVDSVFENTCHSPNTSVSYIGQPLECPFSPSHNITVASVGDLTEILKKEMIEPTNLSIARKCGCVFTLKSDRKVPLWMFCDAADKEKTFLLSISYKDGWCSRSWAHLNSWNFSDGDIDELITKHSKLFNLSKSKSVLRVTSTYSPDEDTVNPALLKITWTTPSIDIPFSVAKTNFLINFKVGFNGSIIKPIWDQLQLLQKFLDVILMKQEVDPENPGSNKSLFIEFNDSDVSPHTIEESLTALLKAANHAVPYLSKNRLEAEKKEKNSFIRVVEDTVSNQKQAIDFTDEIWNILKDCSTYRELQKYMEMIFHQIRKGTLKPVIQRSNGTRLAHKIRCLMADSAYDFEITVNPLEYLIELGIEKLKNDFLSIFSTLITHHGKLCVPSLPSFKDFKSSDISWTEVCSGWLVWLGRMCTSLEVFILTELKLNLKSQGMDPKCMAILNQILERFLASKSEICSLPWLLNNMNHHCEVVVDTSAVKDVVRHKQFQEWRLTLTNEEDNEKYSSSFLCCKPSMFPGSIIEPDIGNLTLDCTTVMTQTSYICSSLHSASSCFNAL